MSKDEGFIHLTPLAIEAVCKSLVFLALRAPRDEARLRAMYLTSKLTNGNPTEAETRYLRSLEVAVKNHLVFNEKISAEAAPSIASAYVRAIRLRLGYEQLSSRKREGASEYEE